jgi:DNA repair protein RAD50
MEAGADEEAYERNVKEREAAVKEAANAHDFSGYDYSPLEEAKVTEFIDKLHELVRKAESDLKKLQVS